MSQLQPPEDSEPSPDETPLVAPNLAELMHADAMKRNVAKLNIKPPLHRRKSTGFTGLALVLGVISLIVRLQTHAQRTQQQRSNAYLACITQEETQLGGPGGLPGTDPAQTSTDPVTGLSTDPVTGLPTSPVDPFVQAAADCAKYQ